MNKNSERRSSIRRPIYHEANLILGLGNDWPCIISDYCPDGMYIKFKDNKTEELKTFYQHRKDGKLSLSFSIVKEGDNEKTCHFTIQAKIAYLMTGALGIRFIGEYPTEIQALLDHQSAQNKRIIPPSEIKHIVSECIQYIQGYMHPRIEELCPLIGEDIRKASVEASSDQLANELMASAEKIEANYRELQALYANAIEDPIGVYKQNIADSSEVNDRLSIIDKGEFEDWLVSRVLVTKSETEYRALLLPLKIRLDALGIGNENHHQSAFGPSLLVSAFQSALMSFKMTTWLEKRVFKLFEQVVMSDLEELYQNLNAILVRNNILPELDIAKVAKMSKTKEAPKKQSAQEQSEDINSASDQAASVADSSVGSASTAQKTSASPASNSTDMSPVSEQRNIDTGNIFSATPPFSNASVSGNSHSLSSNSHSLSDSGQASGLGNKAEGERSADAFEANQQNVQHALSNIVGLMRSLRTKESAAEGGIPGQLNQNEQPVERYSESELSSGLSNLQANALEVKEESQTVREKGTTESLLSRVKENLGQTGDIEKDIDDDQKVAIDVVDRFFLSMRNNPRLSQEAKGHLVKLEVPVLKVLLKDERFFEDHSSSVRAVMNRIAQLGAKGSRLNPASKKKITGLVHKIVDEFEQDTQIFDYALGELDQLIERQNQLYVKNVERVAAAADGVYRIEQAKVAVAKALNQRCQNKKIPLAVKTLIDHGWKELLNLTYLQQGEDSKEWQNNLEIIDQLIEFGENNGKQLDVKVVLPKIQEGLKHALGNSGVSHDVREQLKHLIEKQSNQQHPMVIADLQDVPVTEEDLVRRNINKSHELKPWIITVKSMPLGSWIKHQKGQDEVQYMRLVWIAKGYSKFVFVNHQGMKVIELGLFKFAGYLKDSTMALEMDYEVPMVNQGLDDMVKDVYEKLAYKTSHDEGSGLIKKSEFCRQTRALMKSGRRTSACSLLYIRFQSEMENEHELIDAVLSKKIADTLQGLSSGGSVIGRMGDVDFALFTVENDLGSVRLVCQERLISVCQHDDYISLKLTVVIGESRAHLGFQNPESMIHHAMSPILAQDEKSCLKSSQQIKAQQENALLENKENIPTLSQEVIVTEEGGHQDPETAIIIDEAANSKANQDDFDHLAFDIFGQRAKPLSSEEQLPHLNLIYSVQGSNIIYEPENRENARALDRWWIEKLRQLHLDRDPIWDGIDYVRVKLSGYAFEDESIKEMLIKLCQQDALNANQVCFDLYDCGVIENITYAADMMKSLKSKGFHFCLDHFGSDRSPFSLLKVLPVKMISVDESFMVSMNQSDSDQVATDSIVEVAHYLGKKVLTTSVDTAICLQRMKKLGVDFVQGDTVSEFVKL